MAAEIGHFGKYHNTLCLSPRILHKHCFQFLLGLQWSREKTKTILMQNLGGQTKSIMVFSELAYKVLALGVPVRAINSSQMDLKYP